MKKLSVKFNLRDVLTRKFKKNQPEMRESAIINKNTEFSVKEAYKTLRTNIMFSLTNDGKSKSVVITSAIPGDGKTTTAINLATTFSQIGSKILLIDCDLRKPKIHTYLDVDNKNGLSGVLSGFVKLENAITRTEYGFDCITAGSIPPNPSELISSPALEKIIEELKDQYDYIFIDTPPVTVVSDTLTVSSLSDGVLMVARSKYTPKSLIKQSIASMKFTNSKIIGIVINGVDMKDRAYGSHKGKYYARSRYGGYGYHYYYVNEHNTKK